MSFGMTNDEIKEKLKELIMANCFYEGDFSFEQDLFFDLGYESLSLSALVIELEEAFAISISKEDITNGINTPQKIYELIQRKKLDV